MNATWTGRADTRSVTAETTAAMAARIAGENFAYLQRQAAAWTRGMDATGRGLLQQGLGVLNGLSGAVLDPKGAVQALPGAKANVAHNSSGPVAPTRVARAPDYSKPSV